MSSTLPLVEVKASSTSYSLCPDEPSKRESQNVYDFFSSNISSMKHDFPIHYELRRDMF